MMKNYGKYSKKPEAAGATQPKAKSALLQTYFTSLLCLVLCVVMFFGTTYAWFVSEVNNAGNEIYIGVLDVGLQKQKDTEWVDLADNNNKLFDNTIRWEPGYTALETVQVINEGDLAFKYVLSFTDGVLAETQVETSLERVAKNFEVWVFAHEEDKVPTAKSYEEIIAADSGWVKAGSLDALLAGNPVLTGTMDKVRQAGQETADINKGTADGLKTAKLHTIALHMNADAENGVAVMGQKLSLNVKLIAYQMTSEKDDFGNETYDELNYISTVDGLVDAIANAENGDVIGLAPGTYDLTEKPLVIEKSITLQGLNPNDKPVLQFVTGNGEEGAQKPGIFHGIEIKSDNVTIRDLKLQVDPAKDSSGNIIQISPKSDDAFYSNIVIDGCEFSGSDHCIAFYGNNVTIENCILNEAEAADQGNIIYVWGTSGKLTIRNNTFIGQQKKHGISFYRATEKDSIEDKISGQILIEGNTFQKVYKAIVHESAMTYTDVSVEILNNRFVECLKKPVSIDNGTFAGYKISGNVFLPTTEDAPFLDVDEKVTVVVDASGNYWGTDHPQWNLLIAGDKAVVNDYYTEDAKINLVQIKK